MHRSLLPSSCSGSLLGRRSTCTRARLPVKCVGRKWDEQLGDNARQFAKQTSRKFQKGAKQVSEKFENFVEEKKLKQTAEQLSDSFSRKAQQTFDDADTKFGLRVGARNLWLTVKERAPTWKRKATDFAESPVGRVSIIVGGVYLVLSGAIFKILEIFFLLLWILPLFLPFIARYLNKKMMEEAQQQQEEYQRQQQQQNWYAQSGQRFQDWASRYTKSGRSGNTSSSQGSTKRDKYTQQNGPIIDAEWTTIDDER